LFGWSSADFPIGPADIFSLFSVQGREISGAYNLNPQQKEMGVPPHWMVYFKADDADASAAQAAQLGATIAVPPMDVFDFGRMYVARDPGGAHFSVWQPKQHKGAGVIGEHNTFCWAELNTRVPEEAKAFYTALFGWTTRPHTMPGYTIWGAGGKDWGGILTMDEQWGQIPSHWAVYFSVADCGASIEKANSLGGKVCVPPFEAPGVGTITCINDPAGATFYMIQLKSAMS